MIHLLPPILQNIGIFNHRLLTLFGCWNLGLDFKYLCSSLAMEKNIQVLLISGSIKFYSHDIIMELSSSQFWNFGSLCFGPVLNKWLSFPFPFKNIFTTWDHCKLFFFSFNRYATWMFWSSPVDWSDGASIGCTVRVVMALDISDMVDSVRLNEDQRTSNGHKGERMPKKNTNKIKGKIG